MNSERGRGPGSPGRRACKRRPAHGNGRFLSKFSLCESKFLDICKAGEAPVEVPSNTWVAQRSCRCGMRATARAIGFQMRECYLGNIMLRNYTFVICRRKEDDENGIGVAKREPRLAAGLVIFLFVDARRRDASMNWKPRYASAWRARGSGLRGIAIWLCTLEDKNISGPREPSHSRLNNE